MLGFSESTESGEARYQRFIHQDKEAIASFSKLMNISFDEALYISKAEDRAREKWDRIMNLSDDHDHTFGWTVREKPSGMTNAFWERVADLPEEERKFWVTEGDQK